MPTDEYARDLHEALLHIFYLLGDDRPKPTATRMREVTVPVELVGHPGMNVGCPRCQAPIAWAEWPEHLVWHRSKGEA
jgi:hypothetical protein